jgi:integrase/ribosomal protein L40E
MLENRKLLDTYDMEEIRSKKFLEGLREALSRQEDLLQIELGGNVKRKYFVLKSNLEQLLRYGDELGLNKGLKIYSVSRIVNYVLYFLDFVRCKNLNEVTRDDVLGYLKSKEDKSDKYKFMLKLYLKNFLQWVGRNDIADWIECKAPKYKIDDEKILTVEQIQAMIDVSDNPRDKAMVATLYESGTRIGELMSARIKDLVFDEYGAIISITKSKTKERKIRLVSSVPLLKNWINNFHPFKNNEEAPLFTSFHHGNYGGFIISHVAWVIIKQIARRAKINKNVSCHTLRHSRASHLSGTIFHEPEMRIFFGWSRNSYMPSIYVHLDEEHTNNKILIANGIEVGKKAETSKLQTKACYRCGEVNNTGSKFCWKCEYPLQQDSINRVELVKSIVNEATMFVFEKMKERKVGNEDLENVIKEWYESKGND